MGFVFIDTRPATDLITRSALMAADKLVVVIQPETFAIAGLQATLTAVDELTEYLGKQLPVAGWVINQVDYRRADHAENLENLRAQAAKRRRIDSGGAAADQCRPRQAHGCRDGR